MEDQVLNTPIQQQVEEIPSLLSHVQSNVYGFDEISTPRTATTVSQVPEQANNQESQTLAEIPLSDDFSQMRIHHAHSHSISMPSSPSILFPETNHSFVSNEPPNPSHSQALPPRHSRTVKFEPSKKTRFHSQPMGNPSVTKAPSGVNMFDPQRLRRSNRLRDNRYDSFKTWSGKLERQITTFRGGPPQEIDDIVGTNASEPTRVPKVDRFFDALEGPELDRLRDSEQSVLPADKKWPFLLRFPVSAFGICLGLSSQAILYKNLAISSPTKFLHVPLQINLILWLISFSVLSIISVIYILKVTFYFEAVRREYHHPIRVNFFFAPWIACLFLVIGLPPSILKSPPYQLWYVLMAPILVLELKIYGQWMSGGQRRLSKVANPSNHLSVVGNFVGALLGASMGLKEGPVFFYAVGLAHYVVLFVTLYQRLPTNETLPKELHPVFFLFVAAPSVASMAWAKISGEFGYSSRMTYFIAMFLYASLVVRLNFFRGFRFSLAWWAYTFPMTGAAIATVRYSTEVDNVVTQTLSVTLSLISSLTVTALLLSTMFHAFVLRDLFPNDISIAITYKPSVKLREDNVGKDGGEKGDLESGDSVESTSSSSSAGASTSTEGSK